MYLPPFLNPILNAARSNEGREREVIRHNRVFQQPQIQKKAFFSQAALQATPEEGVIDESIWVGHFIEQLVGIIQITRFRQRTELDSPAHDIVV